MIDEECWGERCNAADADEWKSIARAMGDRLTQLNALSTEVIRAASHGDQQFIQCLVYSDPGTTRLRLAIVALADWLREH
jgi:hypothetical protein